MDYMNNGGYPQGENLKDNKFRLWFLIGALVILIAAIGIGAFVLVNSNSKKQEYVNAVNLGNEYFNAGDYYNAILQYQKAIELNEKDATSYLNMSSVYMIAGDYTSARNIVLRGLEFIDSEPLRSRLAELEGKSGTTAAVLQNLSVTQIQSLSANVMAENSLFDMVAAYTYTDYCRDYGQPVSSSASGGQLILGYSAASFQAVYFDLANERVLDNSGTVPLASVKPCYVTFQSVRSLFASSEEIYAISFEKLQNIMGNGIELTYDENAQMYMVSGKYKGCQVTIETDANGNILSESAWNKVEPLSRKGIDMEAQVDGEVKGYIQDAMTGRGMVATIKVRERGKRNGQAIAQINSAGDGNYTLAGVEGSYTLEITAPGYTTEYIDAEIIRGQVKTGKNVVLSPIVVAGELRIVLSWGASPSDLDSHVQGRSSSGSNFHIYYSQKNANNIGTLDVDDTNGYGPETITMTDSNATFTYSVVDFTQSYGMASSGATVKVYLPGNSQPIVYYIPSGRGNTWTVFKYENGQVSPINTIN